MKIFIKNEDYTERHFAPRFAVVGDSGTIYGLFIDETAAQKYLNGCNNPANQHIRALAPEHAAY